MAAAVADTSSGYHLAVQCSVEGNSACSTPFVSAPSSPARDPSFHAAAGFCFSAPASPARGADGSCDYDFDFDFTSQFPSPATAAMSSAHELFHNGQIRPMQLPSFLLRPPLADGPAGNRVPPPLPAAAPLDERGRFRSRSVHRRSRSLSPFRARWMSPAPAKDSAQTPTSASRSSSSSSTASSASSSTPRRYRRWRFFKNLVHQNKSSSGSSKNRPPAPLPPEPEPARRHKHNASLAAPKTNPTTAARRRSAHERLYEARRAEAEDMRRRTFLPYRQGLLLGCLGFGSRGYGAMHGFAAAKTRC